MSSAFTYLLRVRYSECDQQKVVFNGKYAEYVDIAATEFVRQVWGGFDNMAARNIDFQVVNLNISWLAPALFDDVLAIAVQTAHIGNSSYTLSFEFRNHRTDQKIVTAEAVYVMVSAGDHNKMTIPDDLRTTLEQAAADVLINHAGVELG